VIGHLYTLLLRTAGAAAAYVRVIRWQAPADARVHVPPAQPRIWLAHLQGRVWMAQPESRTWAAPRVRQEHEPPAYDTHTEGTPP
jgi:hypothetical protein